MADSDIAPVRAKRTRLPRPLDNKCTICGFSPVKAKGLCDRHYRTMLRNGDPTTLKIRPLSILCSCEGCERRAVAHGLCKKHYRQARRDGSIKVGDSHRDHPLYSMWWARRKSDALSSEWRDDFKRFVADVGDKPGKFWNLVTLRDGPFGPDNFQWREQIKQRPGESRRAFYARKWKAQDIGRPGWQKVRDLRRRYNLTDDAYEQMIKDQNNCCAICGQPETKMDHQHGTVARLAVDHCHTTGKVRGLLCSRCNVTIGRVGESVEILKAMVAYLEKYQQENSP